MITSVDGVAVKAATDPAAAAEEAVAEALGARSNHDAAVIRASGAAVMKTDGGSTNEMTADRTMTTEDPKTNSAGVAAADQAVAAAVVVANAMTSTTIATCLTTSLTTGTRTSRRISAR